MSQSELATDRGVTFQQLQKYHKGVNRISAFRLRTSPTCYRAPQRDPRLLLPTIFCSFTSRQRDWLGPIAVPLPSQLREPRPSGHDRPRTMKRNKGSGPTCHFSRRLSGGN